MNRVPISAVIPVYRGELTLPALAGELAKMADAWKSAGLPIELAEAIFVDDGSRDGSAQVLSSLQREYAWVRIITLAKNYGPHPATIAGIAQSRGDWIVTLDEDLQHHPQHIRAMLTLAVRDHLDVVYARPADAVHQSLFRDGSSRLCKALIAALTGNPRVRDFNSFRVIRAATARATAAVAAHEPYLDVALCWFTDRFGTHTVAMKDWRFIAQKTSAWTPRSLVAHARRMLVSSEAKWARLIAIVAMTAILSGIALAVQILLHGLREPGGMDGRSWTPVLLAVLFFGGLSAFFVGLLLEYFAANLRHLQNKPTSFAVDRSGDALLESLVAEIPSRDLAA
jgi:glycosyltransferase involved in cell wall biosynthesis